jgi:hypothetical protein
MESRAAANSEFSQYYKFDAETGTFTIDSEAIANANLSPE